RVTGERLRGGDVLGFRLVQPVEPEVKIADLRVMPGERFGVVCAGRFGSQPHRVERAGQVALQFARICDARVGRGARPQTHHSIEGVEGLVVLAKLEMAVPRMPSLIGSLGRAARLRSATAIASRKRCWDKYKVARIRFAS